METKNEKESQEKYLREYLDESTNNNQEVVKETKKISEMIENQQSSNSNFNSPLDYLSVKTTTLPLGIFYKNGFEIKIRSAKVKEIQAYSVVDDKNLLDVTEKMNQILSNCVKVTLPNGQQGSYKDIKDGDRLHIIFMIRELTFQSGNSLAKDVECEHCKHKFSIPFRATGNSEVPKTFTNHDINPEIEEYFDKDEKVFVFKIGDGIYKLSPPTIGIQEIFYDNIKQKVNTKLTPNVSFLKIIPFLMGDRITITEDGIKAKEDEFENMGMETFQILNFAVDKMVFGLKGLTMKCDSCSQEVYSDMTFPNGASSIFLVSNPLKYLNK